MPYVVLRNCVAGGERRSAGDVIELGVDEAASLIAMGRVEPVEVKEAEQSDRSVGLETSDAPAPKKRGRKRAD